MASGYCSDSDEVDPVDTLTGDFTSFAIDPDRAERLNTDAKAANSDEGILFDPAFHTLDKFFRTSAPSKVNRSDGIGWILVRSPSYEDEALGDLKGLQTAWEEVQEAKKTIGYSDIKELALSYRCLGGNWLLFYKTGSKIDNAWKKIARATVLGELGTHAKVTPYKDDALGSKLHGDEHAISVYTKDFTDHGEIVLLERKLRKMGMGGHMAFKPRVYSQLGVCQGNKWGLKASICKSAWDNRSQSYKFVKFV